MSTLYSSYEIVFKNGARVTLDNVNIELEIVDRTIMRMTCKRLPDGDNVNYIDIREVIYVAHKPEKRKRWFGW